jgi:hypothetical protein
MDAVDSIIAAMVETESVAGIGVDLETIPVRRRGLSTETGKRLEDTLRPEARAACARVPSAATTTAARLEVFLPAEAPAWVADVQVADAQVVATAVDAISQGFIAFLSV